MRINLEVVIDAIESAMDDTQYFYNIDTGETIIYGDYILTIAEQRKFEEELERHPFKYIKLPGRFEINDYSIMEEFIWSLPESERQYRLENAINGRGAFRRFKDTIAYYNMEEEWFSYQHQAYRQLAIRWCEDHNLEYIEED